MAQARISTPSKLGFLLLAAALSGLGAILIAAGFAFPGDSTWRVVFHAVGGAVVSLGCVEVLHEISVARKVRAEFLVLGDFIEKGISRVCTGEEIGELGSSNLKATKSIAVLGIGLSWLFRDPNRVEFERILQSGREARILVPDPTSREIEERYEHDEPPDFEIGLPGLAERLRSWRTLSAKYPRLQVRAYTRYPVANVTIFDKVVLVAPVLFQRRAKDNLTAVFRRPSSGSVNYEDHFNKVFQNGSKELTIEFFQQLDKHFPPKPAGSPHPSGPT